MLYTGYLLLPALFTDAEAWLAACLGLSGQSGQSSSTLIVILFIFSQAGLILLLFPPLSILIFETRGLYTLPPGQLSHTDRYIFT